MPDTANGPQAPGAAPLTEHVLIPWATSLSEACQQALTALDDPSRFPTLHHLWGRLRPGDRLEGDEYTPVPPHERMQAAAWGWPTDQPPWAALLARADGLSVGDQAWGLLTPCHWHLGHDHFTMLPPDDLQLDADTSRALFDAVAPLFTDEGWALHWGAPLRWYAVHPVLADLPTASLDRVVGRNPDLWMASHPQARLLRRLQAEVQMLLHQHPLNDEREARGLARINSFWLSGCGVPRPIGGPSPRSVDGPRQALLQGDVSGWLQAWDTIERETLPGLAAALDAGRPVLLTVCGERHAVSLTPAPPPGWWARLQARWRPVRQRPSDLLASL